VEDRHAFQEAATGAFRLQPIFFISFSIFKLFYFVLFVFFILLFILFIYSTYLFIHRPMFF